MEIHFLHLKTLVATGYNWFQPVAVGCSCSSFAVAVAVVHFWVKKPDPTGLSNSR
jgi:hypothetical protein